MRRNDEIDLYELIVEETNREFNLPPYVTRGDVLLDWLELEGVRVSRRTVEVIKRVWGEPHDSGQREAIIAGALRKMFALFDAYGDDLAALSAVLADALLPALLMEGEGFYP